jgi:hypothetical protein
MVSSWCFSRCVHAAPINVNETLRRTLPSTFENGALQLTLLFMTQQQLFEGGAEKIIGFSAAV